MTLFSAYGQFYVFMWAVSFGCITGIAYEVCAFFRRLFSFKLFINIIFDLAFSIFTTFLFIIYFTYVCDFELRFFIFLGIFLGFFFERISIGNGIAKICNIVYNSFNKIKIKIKEKRSQKKALKEEKFKT